MAAKKQVKKVAKAGKRKLPQRRHLLARQKKRKLQARKQRKTWTRLAHNARAGNARSVPKSKAGKKPRRPKPRCTRLYATKRLRQMPKGRCQRKMQAKTRGVMKARRPKPSFPKIYASKMLRQMPKVRMQAKARGGLKTLLTRLYKQVMVEVKNLEKKSISGAEVSGTEVQNAMNDVMTKLLAKPAGRLFSLQRV